MSSPVKGPFCTVWWCLQCVSTRDMLHSWVRFRLPKPQWGTVKGYLLHNHSLSWYIKRHPSSEPAGWAHPVQVRRGCGHSKPETSHLFLTGTKASHISHGWSSGWVEIRDILLFDSFVKFFFFFFLNTRTTHKQRCITGFCFKGSTLWKLVWSFLKGQALLLQWTLLHWCSSLYDTVIHLTENVTNLEHWPHGAPKVTPASVLSVSTWCFFCVVIPQSAPDQLLRNGRRERWPSPYEVTSA